MSKKIELTPCQEGRCKYFIISEHELAKLFDPNVKMVVEGFPDSWKIERVFPCPERYLMALRVVVSSPEFPPIREGQLFPEMRGVLYQYPILDYATEYARKKGSLNE